MIATPGGESNAYEDSMAETETQTTSEQPNDIREKTIRSFGAAGKEWKAPAAIDTAALMHFSKNYLTSPITPARFHESVSPSGAFQHLNLNSPDKSTETNDDKDSDDEDEDAPDNSTCFSRLDLTKRAVMSSSRSHLKDFYFNVFPETMEINSEYFCVGRIVLPTQYDKSCLTLTVMPCGRKLQLLIKRPQSTMSPEFVLCLDQNTLKRNPAMQQHALVQAINSHFKELKSHSEDQIVGKIVFRAPIDLEPQTSPDLLEHKDAGGLVGHVTTVINYDQMQKLKKMKKKEKVTRSREYTRKTIRSFIFVAKKRCDGFKKSQNVKEAVSSSSRSREPHKTPKAPEAKKRKNRNNSPPPVPSPASDDSFHALTAPNSSLATQK